MNQQNLYRATPDRAGRPALGFRDGLAIFDEIFGLCDSLHPDCVREILDNYQQSWSDLNVHFRTSSINLDVADDILNPNVLRLA
jgi:hypothetical protein